MREILIDELRAILESHRRWLRDGDDGCRADLRRADLRGADLRRADLCDADLRGADLRRANLCDADLRGADLCDADLCDAEQKVISIKGSKHQIVAIDDDIRIGCQRMKLSDWLEKYESVGRNNGYTTEQTVEYGFYLRAIEQVLKLK